MKSPFLLVEGCNFEGYPPGGQTAFAEHVMAAFGERVLLVGATTRPSGAVGAWQKKTVGDATFEFFPAYRARETSGRPIVPARIRAFVGFRRFRGRYLAGRTRLAFVQSPEALFALGGRKDIRVCYRFAGVGNPLSISRYGWSRRFASLFDRCLFRRLERADAILASADEGAIGELCRRSNGAIARDRIVLFPTRVDTGVFHPGCGSDSREALGVPADAIMLCSVGRLNRAKGIDLLIAAVAWLRAAGRHAVLVVVGDGEDRERLEDIAKSAALDRQIRFVGQRPPREVAAYLQAADVYVSGSELEGWPTATLEALASGAAVVCPPVSASGDLIRQGENGFVVEERSAAAFGAAIIQASELPCPNEVSVAIAEQFAASRLASALEEAWPALAQEEA